MIKATAKLFVALNGNAKKSQVASGLAWGVLLGFLPGGIIWFTLFIITFFFTHNHGAKIFGMAFIKLLMLIPGPNQIPLIPWGIDALGFYILNIDNLKPVFTSMYNMPFVPFTNFNNTLMAGGLIIGFVLWIPSFFLFMALIPVYRNKVAPKIRESKVVQKVSKFPLWVLIDKAMQDL